MRAALVMFLATLTLGLAVRPMRGQIPASDAPALETFQVEKIHMVDGQSGWAISWDPRSPESALLRTTDGGTHWRDVTPRRDRGHKIGVWRITALSSLVAWVIPADTTGPSAEVFRTTDGGHTWRSAAIPPPAGLTRVSASSISFINPREGWLIVFLVAYSGHEEDEIYHSTDGGETWIKVASTTRDDDSSGLPITGGKDAITFLDSTTGWITGGTIVPEWLYAYATHDGGRTWQKQEMPLPKELTPHWNAFSKPPKFFTAQDGILPVHYSLLNDSGQQSILVAFYATHDGGTTWTYTAPVSVSASEVVYYAVADMNHAWVTHGSVLRATTDGGRQWVTLPPNPPFADVTQLDFISSDVGWAVRNTSRSRGGAPTFPFLLKTLDGGRTWAPVIYGEGPVLETIHMVDARTGWATLMDFRSGGILGRTTDGGPHWKEVTPPLSSFGREIGVYRINVFSSDIAWLMPSSQGGRSPAEIFRTIDGGRTWKRATIPAPAVTSISFINPREGWLMASLFANPLVGEEAVDIHHSTDGGETWTKVAGASYFSSSGGLPYRGGKYSITFLNPTTGWIAGFLPNNLYLYVTHDGGRTWLQQKLPLPPDLTPSWHAYLRPLKFFTAQDGIFPVVYSLLNNSGEAIMMRVVFYATHDGGTTWAHTTPMPVSLSKIGDDTNIVHHAIADMNHAWVQQGNELRVTSDGGRQWATLAPNPLFANVAQIDFISPEVGWAAGWSRGSIPTFSFLLRTQDGGSSWSPIAYTTSRQ